MEKFLEDFRMLLKKSREASGLTQEAMAAALEIGLSTYVYYEDGKILPDLPTLRKIAGILHVPAEALLYPERAQTGGQ